MLSPKKFYRSIWKDKETGTVRPLRNRDWFHRVFLDKIFNPLDNPRHEIAVKLLCPGDRFLDIGCWDGRILDLIQSAGLYKELYGIDISEDAIEKTRTKGYQAQVVDLNGESLPFPDAYFDGITMLAVLEHVFDPYTMIHEIRRVLAPKGLLILDVPNVASFSNRIRILFGRQPVTSTDPGWDGGHLHYFTKHDLDRFLLEQGFDVLLRKTTGGYPHLREWWLSLLAGELIYQCRRR